MPNLVYNSYLRHLMSGTINLATDPIYVMLVSGSYVPNQSTHSLIADVSAHQVTDPLFGYITGGQLLAGKSIALNGNSAVFSANNVSWNPTTITAASGAVLYMSGTAATGKHLICYVDLGVSNTSNGTFQIVWNTTNGIFRLYGA